ncbi:MAG TPA: hypothetical protein VHZ98_14035 [Galbitalea sp.]|nr:hypothetical protein [Galbitalea sp.]
MTSQAPVDQPARRGAPLIIAATVIAGIAGYAVTFLVLRFVGAAAYAVFAAFWAAMYLIVGGVSGVQQEIARATHPIAFGSRNRPNKARNFALITAGALFVLILVTSPAWAPFVFRADGEALVVPLAVGTSSYVLVATLSGALYGLSQWRSIFLMIITDGLLRLIFVLIVFIFTRDILWIAWAAALPLPLTIALLWRFIRPGLVGRSELDVGYRDLTWNVARTVLASISTAALVSGFPLILAVAGKSASATYVGHLIFAITITRAPLIVTVMALQSFFVVHFRENGRSSGRTLGLALGVLLLGGVLLATLAWWIGPSILNWLFGESGGIGSEFVTILVISSAMVAGLTVTGSAVLARSRHFVYSFGWVMAAITTILLMSLPIALTVRIESALLAGPVVGLLFHCVWLGWYARRHSASDVPQQMKG